MKDFNRTINNKRQISENEGLTLNRVGERGHGKGEVPSAFFTSTFTDKICPEESQLTETNEKG